MQFTSTTLEEMSETSQRMLFNYRYQVFITHLGWEIILDDNDEINQWEKDEFDSRDTVYVYARNPRGSVTGCARLLPTTSDYLLQSVFPKLLNGNPAPNSGQVWELSRFTTLDLTASGNGGAAQFSSEASVELLREVFSVAQSKGAKHIVTVSPIGVERLLRKEGFKSIRMGPPIKCNGHWLVACWIDL
jgi:acyl homoserine lactone synthase